MNKKGFSLVELMIVVVIMGILIAVAIPLYGAIKDNANNKTCLNNIKTIKSNAANYAASYNVNVDSKASLKTMFDDGKLPDCPFDQDGDETDYTIYISNTNGSAKVSCAFDNNSGATEKHSKQIGETAAPASGYTTLA
ncbi:MAG: prepilin-type N-terminal cleavage/methylation domain-containing protein [Clostridiales bacterium]|nr:prepilin-type N-terminal cleavage/methylation domain-containing protein [Clostridiales bacterium]